MPDQNASFHRVHGCARGVNWRATKFAEAVPQHITCTLCRMISRATVFLPCLHTLCESCASRSVSEGNIVCPLDEESFPSEQYRKVDWPTGTADNLKACCWNEAQGCTFVGTLQEVLTHYEQECAFHAVACPRCNGPVLQQDLPSHYRAGCYGEAIASAAVETRSCGGVMVSAEAIETGLEELKALIRDPDQQQFPALQSKINELLEQTRNIDSQIEEVATLCRDSEHRLTQALGELSTTSWGKFQSQEALLGARSKENSETNEIAKQLKSHGTQLQGIAKTLRDSELRISDQLAQAVQELSATFAQKLQSQQRELPAQTKTSSKGGRKHSSEAGTTNTSFRTTRFLSTSSMRNPPPHPPSFPLYPATTVPTYHTNLM